MINIKDLTPWLFLIETNNLKKFYKLKPVISIQLLVDRLRQSK